MITHSKVIRNETYKIIKDFVKGFARNSISVSKQMKEQIKGEAYGVIDTYFPIDTNEKRKKNDSVNQDLKAFYDDLEGREVPEKVDEYMCMKGYLVKHGEEMNFPKQRCEHCNGYGAYNVPEDNHEVRFCAKYDPIGKRIKDLEGLAKSND